MKNKTLLVILSLLFLTLVQAACRQLTSNPTATPLASPPASTAVAATTTSPEVPGETPTIVTIPTGTGIPATATGATPATGAAPAPIATATETAPAIPDRALSPDGPWLLIRAENGLWICNPDGSGLFRLLDHELIAPQKSLSPDGRRLAFVSLMMPQEFFGFELFVMGLPSGEETEHLASLAPNDRLEGVGPGDPAFEAREAIYHFSPPAWSPDGKKLAFMGAINGPSSDLYVYDFESGEITQLTDGPSQGFQPSWSPDGKWIVHTGAESFGTGAGYVMRGIWAARADGLSDEVKSLYTLKDTAQEEIIGWASADRVAVHSWDMRCGGKNLRTVSVETKEVKILWPYSFSDFWLAGDPANGALMAAVGDSPECNGGQEPGVYLVRTDGSQPQWVAEEGLPSWSPEGKLFLVELDAGGMKAFTPDGEEVAVSPDFPTWPGTSPTGELWAAAGDFRGQASGIWLGPLGGPVRRITEDHARLPTWSPDGQTLLYFGAEGRMYAAAAPGFIPVLVSDQISPVEDPFWAGGR